MKINKGFSLIELMIVVAIIGILSLLALPFYNNYVLRVKLTEKMSIHMRLVNQLITDYESAVGDVVYTDDYGYTNSFGYYVSSLCKDSSSITGNVPYEFICTTDAGILPDSKLDFFGGDKTNADAFITITKKGSMARQNINIWQNSSSHMINSQLFLRSDDVPRSQTAFNFSTYKNPYGRYPSRQAKIMTESGELHPIEPGNRWYCGSTRIDGSKKFPLEKSLRPKSCPYGSLGYSDIFYED